MVSVTEELDPVTLSTALTAPISALLPPTSGEISATSVVALPLSLSHSLSSIPSHHSLPLSSSLPSGAATEPPTAQSPANVSSTIELIHHLLTSLKLHPQDIATLLTSSTPFSISPTPLSYQSAASLTATVGEPSTSPNPSRQPPSSMDLNLSRHPSILPNPNNFFALHPPPPLLQTLTFSPTTNPETITPPSVPPSSQPLLRLPYTSTAGHQPPTASLLFPHNLPLSLLFPHKPPPPQHPQTQTLICLPLHYLLILPHLFKISPQLLLFCKINPRISLICKISPQILLFFKISPPISLICKIAPKLFPLIKSALLRLFSISLASGY